jgi:hypothetical protein
MMAGYIITDKKRLIEVLESMAVPKRDGQVKCQNMNTITHGEAQVAKKPMQSKRQCTKESYEY